MQGQAMQSRLPDDQAHQGAGQSVLAEKHSNTRRKMFETPISGRLWMASGLNPRYDFSLQQSGRAA